MCLARFELGLRVTVAFSEELGTIPVKLQTNMKNITILTIIIVCLQVSVFGQEKSFSEEFKIEGVVQMDGQTKEQLYEKAKLWTLTSLKTSDNLNEFDDEEHSRIIATGTILLQNRVSGCGYTDCKLNFKMLVIFKEGRYKYTIDNMVHHYIRRCGHGSHQSLTAPIAEIGFGKKMKSKIYDEVEEKLKTLMQDLQKTVDGVNEDDDW